MNTLRRLWITLLHPQLWKYPIIIWRGRLSIWIIDVSLKLADWVHPKGMDEL